VIRTDLPDDLLCAWLFALDQASDQWLMRHWPQLNREACATLSDATVAALLIAARTSISGLTKWNAANFLNCSRLPLGCSGNCAE
jgi:hypothetical protein